MNRTRHGSTTLSDRKFGSERPHRAALPNSTGFSAPQPALSLYSAERGSRTRSFSRCPPLAVAALSLAIIGLITGSLIRFNAIKVRGAEYADAGPGYTQLFVDDIEYVVTDKWDLGSTAIRLLTATHVTTVPILLFAAWYTFTRIGADDRSVTVPE